MSRNARIWMHACSILINLRKCPAKSKRKPPRCNFRGSVCDCVVFYVRIRVAVYVSLRRRVRRTLNDLSCPYFLPEVTVRFTTKAKGHFVTFI